MSLESKFDYEQTLRRDNLATAVFIGRREDFSWDHTGTVKAIFAQAIGPAVILQGCRVFYREAHVLLEERIGRQRQRAHKLV